MQIVAMLSFALVAAGIAVLVLRGNASPRRHASVRPSDLEPPTLPGRGPAPAPRRSLAVERDVTPLLATVRMAGTRVFTTARPQFARVQAVIRGHPTVALAAVGGVALAVMLLTILAQPRDDSSATAQRASQGASNVGTRANAGSSATAAPAVAPSAAPTVASTPPAAEAGAPLSGDALIAAWTAAGLKVENADAIAACGATKPRAYRANGSQVAMVFVYASPAALSADWAVERGAPLAFRAGGCLPTGAITYWNQNIVLSFPQIADTGVKQRMSDALLRMVVAP